MNFKKMCSLLLAGATALSLAACNNSSGGSDATGAKNDEAKGGKKVMLYSSLKEDQLAALKEGFSKKYPDIVMDYYAAGTGKVLTKIATEQQSGQVAADLIWVGDPSNYLSFKEKGMLEPYESEEAAEIDAKFKDPDNQYIGARMIVLGFAVNTNLVSAENEPKNWDDLTKEEFKKQLVISDPAEAGTTMYAVSGLVDNAAYGWEYFKKLKANEAELESSTSSTINKVGAGAYKVCIAVDYVTKTLEQQGSPIKFIYPEKDLIFVSSPIALLKGAPNPDEGKLLYDYILSEEGQKILAEKNATPVRNGITPGEGSLDAKEIAARAMNVDDAKIAGEKQSVLDEFDKLFK